MKTILFVATTLAIAVSTLNNDTVPKKRVPDSIDSLLAKSKTNFVKANSSIKVAEKMQKENFETIKSKITALELENKTLTLKLEHYEDTIVPVTDTVEQFNLFPSN
jgi:siroheme synthase (precorrin-2 oxidase/ferrochelatase)